MSNYIEQLDTEGSVEKIVDNHDHGNHLRVDSENVDLTLN